MLGIKAKIVSGRHRFSSGLYSGSGTNVSSRIIRRCIRSGTTLLNKANHRFYSSKGGIPPPESFGGPDVPLHQRLANAWKQTPTTWYPLPIAVGALLLIAIQYRKRLGQKEVYVDEEGHEVVKLKGPWTVHVMGALPLRTSLAFGDTSLSRAP
ncbi:uncharacterized protein PHACADRAFT_203823, partial [Phanerochaete carnosa HHB-10118-sp]